MIDDRQVSSRTTHKTSEPTPIKITEAAATSNSISVKWLKSIGIKNYEIEVKLADINAQIDSKYLDSSIESYIIEGLIPFTEYSVILKSHYTHGIFTTTEKVEVCNGARTVVDNVILDSSNG